MANLKLFLNNAAAAVTPTVRGTWSDGTPLVTKKCSTSKDAAGNPAMTGNQVGDGTANHTYLMMQLVSDQLGAATYFRAGAAITGVIGVRESSSSCNSFMKIDIFVINTSDAVVGTLLNYVDAQENAASTNCGEDIDAATVANTVTAAATDRIVIEIGVTHNTTNTSYYSNAYYGGSDVDIADGQDASTRVGWVNIVTQDAPDVSNVNPTSAPALVDKTGVILTGTNFLGATGVTVGGHACTSVVVDSATQITCTFPAHAAAVDEDVIVTTPAGSSTPDADTHFSWITPTKTYTTDGIIAWDEIHIERRDSNDPVTFGNTSEGSNEDGGNANNKVTSQFTLSTPGLVTKLTAYFHNQWTSHTATTLIGIIYEDTDGAPTNLKGTTVELSVPDNLALGWHDLTFDTPVYLAADNYWLGLLHPANGLGISFRWTTTGLHAWNADTYSDGPSDPFGSPGSWDETYSMYATYTAWNEVYVGDWGENTFGITDETAVGTGQFAANNTYGQKVTLTENAIVSSISVLAKGREAGAGQTFRMAIYSDAGGTSYMGDLLFVTEEHTVLNSETTYQWHTLNKYGGGVTILPPDNYWIFIWPTTTSNDVYFNLTKTSGGTTCWKDGVAYSATENPPSPMTGEDSDVIEFSWKVNYTPTWTDTDAKSTPGSYYYRARRNIDGTYSEYSDEYLVMIGNTKTYTTDGIIAEGTATETKTYTTDGYIAARIPKTYTTDGYVGARKTKTCTIDGYISLRTTKTYTEDGIIVDRQAKTYAEDGFVCVRTAKTYTTDGYIILCGGGITSIDGDYAVHIFNTNGTLVCSEDIAADLLLVGGGGGGDEAGGGAGEYVTPVGGINLSGNMEVVIGSGGNAHTVGEDSTLATIHIAKGGGRGGATDEKGGTGASGGGGGASSSIATQGGDATAYPNGGQGQGNIGGGNAGQTANPYPCGGGGGAGGQGQTPSSSTTAGNGGIGYNNDIIKRGTDVGYSGGGGGSTYLSGTPGTASHGGAAGSVGAGNNATPNTGGGGGGGRPGGIGGSGIAVIRYLNTEPATKTYTVDGTIIDGTSVNTKTYTADGFISERKETEYSIDGYIVEVEEESYTLDGFIAERKEVYVGTNYFTNPSLETWTNGPSSPPDGISLSMYGHTGGLSRVAALSGCNGDYAMRFQVGGNGTSSAGFNIVGPAVIAGETLTVSIKAQGTITGCSGQLYIVGSGWTEFNLVPITTSAGVTTFSVSYTFNNSYEVSYIYLFIVGVVEGDSADIVIDDMCLTKSTAFVPYFDGSYPGCEWTGEANASTSIRNGMTIDGYIAERIETTYTTDGFVKEILVKTYTVDGVILVGQEEQYTIDGNIKVIPVIDSVVPSQTPKEGGETLTIYGHGFTNAVDVAFLVEAPIFWEIIDEITVISDTEMTVIAPDRPTGSWGGSKIYVRCFDGTYNTTSNQVDFAFVDRLDETYTLDGYIGERVDKIYTLDGYVGERSSKTYTIDSLIKEILIQNYTIDGIVKEENIKVYSLDGYVGERTEESYTIDGIVLTTNEKTYTLTGYVAEGHVVFYFIDGIILETKSKDYSLDGIIGERVSLGYTVDGIIVERQTKTLTSDGFVAERTTQIYTEDGFVAQRTTTEYSVDGIVKEIKNSGYTQDGTVIDRLNKEYTIDGVVLATYTTDYTKDGMVVERKIIDYTIDGTVLLIQTKTYTINGSVLCVQTLNMTIDGIILEQRSILTGSCEYDELMGKTVYDELISSDSHYDELRGKITYV